GKSSMPGKISWLVISLAVISVFSAGCAPRASTPIGNELRELARETMQLVQLSTAFAEAQEATMSDAHVIERLGEPIELASQPARQGTGNLKTEGETFQFSIQGPKGSANVCALAVPLSRVPDSIFIARKISAKFADGSVVEVPLREVNEKQQ